MTARARATELLGIGQSAALMAVMHLRNVTTRRSAVDPTSDAPVVSLTSHGRRVFFAHLAIESIARGSVRPSRIVLWLDPDDGRAARPPRALARLVRRGLEIRCSPRRYGPHTKYYLEVTAAGPSDHPIVTSDDDVMHPRSWLASLVIGAGRHPGAVIAHRAHSISMTRTGAIAPYATWSRAGSDTTSSATFALGVGGVLYPPGFQRVVRQHGDAFLERAPRADDVWLHFLAVTSSTPVVALGLLDDAAAVPVRGHGTGGLWIANVAAAENDRQIEATYTEAALTTMKSALPGH